MKYQARLVNGKGKTKHVFGAKYSESEAKNEAWKNNPKNLDVYLDTIDGKKTNSKKI